MKKEGLSTAALGLGLLAGGEMPTAAQVPAPHVRTLASFEAKERPAGDGKPLSPEELTKQAIEERRLWEGTYKGGRLTDLHSVETNGEYMRTLAFWLQNTNGDKKAAFEKLAPDLQQFHAYSARGNVLATGVVATASNDMQTRAAARGVPIPNTEVKNPRYARADVALGMPFGEISMATDDKHLTIEFPQAADDITLRPTNIPKLFHVLTTDQPEELDSKSILPVYREEDKKDATVKALRLMKASLGEVALTTAPGVQVNLQKVQGTKENPVVIRGMGNADYILGPNMKHVKLVIERVPPLGVQKAGIAIVPPEMARKLKIKQTYYAASPDEDGIQTLSSSVTFYNEEAGVEIVFNGRQLAGKVLKGEKIVSINGVLRVADAKDPIDINVMQDGVLCGGNYTHKKETDEIDSLPLHKQVHDACETMKSRAEGRNR